MKIEIKDLEASYRILHPRLAVVIGSGKFGKDENFMACTWITPISENIFGISISKENYTFQLIEKYKEFSVNILPFEKKDLIFKLGTTSGRKINKVKEFNLKVTKGKKTDLPILNDSIAFAECKVIKELDFEYEKFYAGEVLHAEYESDFFDEKYGYNLDKIKLPLHLRSNIFVSVK
jgi:flavin reductase (DIM6/NTAB) family NADH-FMN oxidoreductase RutF